MIRHNLPVESTSFVGRGQALAVLKRLLSETRLLTLTGPGGCGKTRLALRLAGEVIDRYRDGVWLVELAAVSDPALVPQTVASVLGVQREPGYPPTAALALALATRQALLVLDNCEHVVDACAELVAALLAESSSLRVLATSRESLRVAGEVTWSLPPLEPPGLQRRANELAENEAVRLFVERARARLPAFALTEANAEAIAEICRRVDGIPLAIELAAALVSTFSVHELAALLDDAMPVLVHGQRAVARQTTLRSTFDWSYALLGEQERLLFRRLAVFQGGWGLEAAIAVCAAPAPDLPAIERGTLAATLAALVDKSMVLAADANGGVRYRLLEPLRQYARELLVQQGELEALERAHALHFTALVEAHAPALSSAHRGVALERLARDPDNLRAALAWALPSGDEAPPAERAGVALRLAGALFGFWHFHGPRVEGLQWTEAALRWRGGRADAVAAEALRAAGEFAGLLGDYELARTRLGESIRLWRALDDPRGLAYALQGLAPWAEEQSRWPMVDEALVLFARVGDPWGAALARFDAGFLALQDGDPAAARRHVEEALAQFRALGDDWFCAQVLIDLGDIERSAGRLAAAATRYSQALTLVEACGDTILLPSVLYNLGVVALERGQTRGALRWLRQALALFRDRADRRGIAECLIGLGGVLGAMKQPESAVRLYGAAEALLAQTGAELWMTNVAGYARGRDAARSQLTHEQFTRAWTAGQALSLTEALAEALPEHAPAASEPATAPEFAAHALDALTQREREVVTLLAQGYTNRQIAAALVISTGTAGLHVKHILHKLGCSSRAQAAAWAVSAGLAARSDRASTR